MKPRLNALARSQKTVLTQLAPIATQQGFYLGGGTAIALHLGHRRSIDFDWFTMNPISDPMSLANKIRDEGIDLVTTGVEAGTLHGSISGIKVSFLEYRYPLLGPLSNLKGFHCNVASLDDLACMKLSALSQRGSKKDFVDIYALMLKHRHLPDLVNLYMQKYDIQDIASVLYGLAYFDDADDEPMPRMLWKTNWTTIKKAIRNWLITLPQ
jgi:hypothetical protein